MILWDDYASLDGRVSILSQSIKARRALRIKVPIRTNRGRVSAILVRTAAIWPTFGPNAILDEANTHEHRFAVLANKRLCPQNA